MVPHTRLGICERKLIAVSRLWGAQSLDIPSLRTTSPQHFSSDEMKVALRQASGLLAFHAWLGTQDHKDEHVMVIFRCERRSTKKRRNKDYSSPATSCMDLPQEEMTLM